MDGRFALHIPRESGFSISAALHAENPANCIGTGFLKALRRANSIPAVNCNPYSIGVATLQDHISQPAPAYPEFSGSSHHATIPMVGETTGAALLAMPDKPQRVDHHAFYLTRFLGAKGQACLALLSGKDS